MFSPVHRGQSRGDMLLAIKVLVEDMCVHVLDCGKARFLALAAREVQVRASQHRRVPQDLNRLLRNGDLEQL